MKKFLVLQIILSEEEHKEINAKGWESEIGSEYLKATHGKSGVSRFHKKVAFVYGESLDVCYAKTQHIESDWTENTDVKAFAPARSSSVGDIFQLLDEDDSVKESYVVDHFGFEKI